MQSTGMSFTGIGLGMILAISSQPYWNRSAFLLPPWSAWPYAYNVIRVFAREAENHGGKAPPETRLRMGEVGGLFVPIGIRPSSS
jgi:hypothetical protein